MSDQNTNPAPASSTPSVDLTNLDVIVLLDFSGTMSKTDCRGGMSRLAAMKESAAALAKEMEAFDKDGITVVKFASKTKLYDGVTAEKVEDIFLENRAMGGTDTKGALQQVIDKFLAKGANKPICILCFTDGVPDDKVGVAEVIVGATKRIKSRTELGILFVQVGGDTDASNYLKKLNDDLTSAGAAHDIVAVVKLDDLEDFTSQDLVEKAFTE